MAYYTFANFQTCLKKSEQYMGLYENAKSIDDEIPTFKEIPETENIENLDDFINIFNTSNEWIMKEYPLNIYLFSLIWKDDVIELLKDTNNSYSRLFLKNLSSSLLKYRYDIYNYAELNYGKEFIDINPILTELKNTADYDVKFNYIQEEVERFVINHNDKTYDDIPITVIKIEMNIFKNGILEKVFEYYSRYRISTVNPQTFFSDIDLFYDDTLDFNNIHLSDIRFLSSISDLDKLEELLYSTDVKNYDDDDLSIYPFQIIDGFLCVVFPGIKDNYSPHLLNVNEFNRNKFLGQLKNVYYSDSILLTEKFDNEVFEEEEFTKNSIKNTYPDYRYVKYERKIKEIPFTIKY